MVWKGSTEACLTTAYIPKITQNNKRIWYSRYLRKWVWVTIALCLTSDVFPRVRRINRTNKQTTTKSSLKNFAPYIRSLADQKPNKVMNELLKIQFKKPESLPEIGFHVRAVISDNLPSNVAAFNDLQSKFRYALHENTILYPSATDCISYLFFDSFTS